MNSEAVPPMLSVVLPCHDESGSLPKLVAEIRSALDAHGIAWEIVAVDDASSDDTVAVIERLGREDARVRLARHALRCGQSAALVTGFRAARAAVLATLDADGQNDPADLPLMLRRLEHCDAVCGVRSKRHDTWIRRVSSKIGNGFRNGVTGVPVTDAGCAARVFRREVIAEMPVFNGMHRFFATLAQVQGFRVEEMPVQHRHRIAGKSHYGIGNRALRGILDCLAMRWYRRRAFPARRSIESSSQIASVVRAEAAPPDAPKTGRGRWRGALLLSLFAGSLALVHLTPLRELWNESGLQALQRALDSWGAAAPIAFVVLASVGIGIGAPRIAFATLAGVLYGEWVGSALAQLATTVGSLLVFAWGRWIGRDALRGGRFANVLAWIEHRPVASNVVIRICPIGNNFATNLLYAASRVRTRHFLLGTTLGTFPETLVYALLGAGVRSASTVRLGVAAVLLLSLAIVHLRYSTRRAPPVRSAVEKLSH